MVIIKDSVQCKCVYKQSTEYIMWSVIRQCLTGGLPASLLSDTIVNTITFTPRTQLINNAAKKNCIARKKKKKNTQNAAQLLL